MARYFLPFVCGIDRRVLELGEAVVFPKIQSRTERGREKSKARK